MKYIISVALAWMLVGCNSSENMQMKHWVLFSKTKGMKSYYMITEKTNGTVTVWNRMVEKTGIISVLVEYKCQERQYRWLKVARYYPSGKLLDSRSHTTEWVNVYPGTNLYRLMEIVCSK